MGERKILVINPGSTSTKVALFCEDQMVDSREILHSPKDLSRFASINDQLDFRQEAVLAYLRDLNVKPECLDAIACRGGTVGELESGAYVVDQEFADASFSSAIPHPANLAPVIGWNIAKKQMKSWVTGRKSSSEFMCTTLCADAENRRKYIPSLAFQRLKTVFDTCSEQPCREYRTGIPGWNRL